MKRVWKSKPVWIAAAAVLASAFLAFSIWWNVEALSARESGGIERVVYRDIMEEKDVRELAEESSLVLRGKVCEKSKAFQIRSVTGAISHFTDFYIEPLEVLRGTAEAGETGRITVRTEGGLVGQKEIVAESAPDLEVGEEYLLFLYQTGSGGGFETGEDYYYVTGSCQGAMKAASAPRKGESSFYSQNGLEDLREMRETLEEANRQAPPEKDRARQESLENLKGNLETGFITQEEYDAALERMQQYATMLDESGKEITQPQKEETAG